MDQGLKLVDWIGRRIQVVVDRQRGSCHPDNPSLVYELNYGLVPGTTAPDGEPLDVYIIDADLPLDRCDAEVIAIVRRRDDAEDKLVARVGNGSWSAGEIEALTMFQEQWFDAFVEVDDVTDLFEHGYTNRTVRDGMTVVKDYLGPDASARHANEESLLRTLDGQLPVPEVVDSTTNRLRTKFVSGTHGKDLMTKGSAVAVLEACGETLQQIHRIDARSVFPAAPEGSVVVHGDYGPNNVLFNQETLQVVAVLDWEWAHPGDRIEDVAWCEWIVRTFHSEHIDAMAAFYTAYGERPSWSSRQAAMLSKLEQLHRFAAQRDPERPVAATRIRQLAITETWTEYDGARPR